METKKAFILKDEDGILRPQAFLQAINAYNTEPTINRDVQKLLEQGCTIVVCEIIEVKN